MSVIVAIKYKNGVILGADKQVTYGNVKIDTATKINITSYSNIGWGCVGAAKLSNAVEVTEELIFADDILKDVEIDKKYLITETVPNLFELFKHYNCAYTDQKGLTYFEGAVILCTENIITTVDGDGTLIEYPLYTAIGSGEQLVTGYLDTFEEDFFEKLNEVKAIELVKNCIQKACKNEIYIDSNIDIIILKRVTNASSN